MLLIAIAISTLAPSLVAAPVTVQTPQASSFTLTDSYRKDTLQALYKAMADRYVMPDIAKKIEADLRKREAAGEFSNLNSGPDFATKINELLKAQVTDAHLRFRYSERPLPERKDPGEPSPDEIRQQKEQTRLINAGFEKVERLRGNIGYISFNFFASPEDMKRPVAAAFEFLADTDALIIDLRGNGGGDPAGVRLFCSYLFDKKVHLNSIYFREGNRTEEFWTLPKVDGPRYLNRDVYVLTSKRTGSGAEECSYDLQNLKRATIVGEPTWGGANPGGTVRLNEHFQVFVPVGRAINPYTKTNWEGTGVKPDIAENPAQSLKTTHIRIVKDLLAKSTDPDRKEGLTELIKTLEGEPAR